MTTKRLAELRESFSGAGVLMRFSNFYQAADAQAKSDVAKKCRDEIAELFMYIDTCRESCAELVTSVTTLSTALRDQGAETQALRAKAEAGKRDTARLDFIIRESNEGRGWLEDSVWDVASNECEGGLDDTPAGYVRAHIDDQMKKSAVKESNAKADRTAGKE